MKPWFVVTTLCLLTPASAQAVTEWTESKTGQRFVKISAACYSMGTSEPVLQDEVLRTRYEGYPDAISDDEVPVHEVCLNDYWIGMHEVRVRDWNRVMPDSPKAESGNPEAAVANVSWEEARRFAERLSDQTGQRFRLPTEAEWEYACRAGFDKPLVVQFDELAHTAWYNRQVVRRTEPQPVGQLEPNAFGLYDMLGNVWEWTQDSYRFDAYSEHPKNDPVIQTDAGQRVMRGASFRTEPIQTRCTVRGHLQPSQKLPTVGFRLVREAGE